MAISCFDFDDFSFGIWKTKKLDICGNRRERKGFSGSLETVLWCKRTSIFSFFFTLYSTFLFFIFSPCYIS
ncbi:unnamed protein product [Coffea canephora]|uniref:Uncharacterized protein n=1 Tax=Coffea canephora TaxID=49390 RepID=A0A068UMT4_COFCA|nr:unnamed protein product [Coffea canephora]